MAEMHLRRFFISIVFPSILAVAFFILLIFLVIIPSFEKNIMDGKKETISELTNSAISLIDEYYHESMLGHIAADSAKLLAAERVREIRFGDEEKDYFWIINERPEMIMHPYRKDLVGEDLSDYRDPKGKLLFVEAAHIISEKGDGFIDYMWQWKDDSTRIVPKLSYVKGFKPWGWIIGTGVYLEDVRSEIRTLKGKLLKITSLFSFLIAGIWVFIIRQSLMIERERSDAESKLRLSRQRYKSLVEASTEGTLMILNDKIVFSNEKFSILSGYAVPEVREMNFDSLFTMKWEQMKGMFSDPKVSISRESELLCNDGVKKEVVLSASMVTLGGEKGYIIIVKEVSTAMLMEKETIELSRELRASLQLMNQEVAPWIKPMVKCPVNSSIKAAAELMQKRGADVLFLEHDQRVIGVINSNDLRDRVIAGARNVERPVSEVMTSPVIAVRDNSRMYEVMLTLNKHEISHVATTNAACDYTGVIGYKELYGMQQNSIGYMAREIEHAIDVNQLIRIYQRIPVLVKAMVSSGEDAEVITRMLSTVADGIHKRIIELAIENQGQPPCRYAFMVMGSEGRMEPSLATDQDNAIVFEGGDDEKNQRVKGYFLRLAEQVNRDLNNVGYTYCRGNVMALNPQWTQPVTQWEKYFSDWVNNSTPTDVLDAAIFFDFRFLHGDKNLVVQLKKHVAAISQNKPVFIYHLAQSVLTFKPPLNIFSKVSGATASNESLEFDIKKAIFPLVAFIRLHSLKEQVWETNSIDRLNRLLALNITDSALTEEIRSAYNTLMRFRLKAQLKDIGEGKSPGNHVDLTVLSAEETGQLKKSFSTVIDLQTKTGFDFKPVN